MKCNSSYPSKASDYHIKTIIDFKKRFNVISGLSDHSLGSSVAIASVAIGASVIEKHITLNDKKKSVDSFFSLNNNDFKKFVDEIRLAESSIGKINYNLSNSSKKNLYGRRSIYISEKIQKGEKITKNNIKIVRPSFSLHPKYFDRIIGSTVKKNFQIGDRIYLRDIYKNSK